MSILLTIPTRLVLGNVLKTPFVLGTTTALIGGGAIAGVAKVEHDHQSISKAFVKAGEYLSSVFGSSDNSVSTEGGSSFLDQGVQSVFTFFSNLPDQISNLYSTVSPHVQTVFGGLKEQDYSSLLETVKNSGIKGEDIKEVLNELGEKQAEVKKIVEKLIEQSELVKNVYNSVSKSKDEYLKVIKGIAEKSGGYKQLLKFALQESSTLTEQLTKLKDKGSDISSKLETTVKKLNEKQSEIEEITKDVEWSNFTKEGGAGSHIKKNLGDYIVELSEKSSELDSGISTLKTQKDKLKKLISDSGNSIAGGLEKKEELSKALDLDSSGGLKLSDVFNNLKDIKEDAFSKLETIQQKMTSSPQAAKILVRSAGKGGAGFVKVINNGSKYEALISNNSSSG